MRLLMLSSEAEAELCFYPDSAKVRLYGRDVHKTLDESAELDYFDGEE